MTLLVGTTIGAGIYGIPYAVNQTGILVGVAYLFSLGGIVLMLNLLYGEVILRTPGDHQLTGYGQIYLGRIGRWLATASLFIAIYGAHLAYLIKIGEFAALISNQPYPVLFSLIFWLIASLIILFGLKSVTLVDIVLQVLMFLSLGLISLISLPYLKLENFPLANLHFSNLLLPYGIILFALSGTAAIPETEEVLRSDRSKLIKAIFIGSLVPVFVYLLFTLVIIGVSGPQTSNDAISGLKNILPDWVVNFGAFLGIITMSTAFISLGYVLAEVWHRDYKMTKTISFTLSSLPLLILFFFTSRNFIAVLEFSGALTGGLAGILIILLYLRSQKMGQQEPAYSLNFPPAVLWTIFAIFLLGMFFPFFTG